MNSRQKRARRILELRQRELDGAKAILSRKRTEADAAVLATREGRQRLEAAEQRHDDLRLDPIDPTTWAESAAWVHSEGRKLELLVQAEADALLEAERARSVVLAAQTNVDRIEAWLKRLRERETIEEARAERKLDDEFARRSASEKSTDL